MALAQTLGIARSQIPKETAPSPVNALVLVGPSRVDVVRRDELELTLLKRQVWIDRFQPVFQRNSPNVNQRFLEQSVLEHPSRLGLKTPILVAHLRQVFLVA